MPKKSFRPAKCEYYQSQGDYFEKITSSRCFRIVGKQAEELRDVVIIFEHWLSSLFWQNIRYLMNRLGELYSPEFRFSFSAVSVLCGWGIKLFPVADTPYRRRMVLLKWFITELNLKSKIIWYPWMGLCSWRWERYETCLRDFKTRLLRRAEMVPLTMDLRPQTGLSWITGMAPEKFLLSKIYSITSAK